MKLIKKTCSFFAFLLLATPLSTYSMKRTTPTIYGEFPNGQIIELVSIALTDDSGIKQVLEAFPFLDLPDDLKKEIIKSLISITTASSLNDATKGISSLSLVNKELNTLINSPQFCLELIKHLAQKFNCTDQQAAEALPIKEAKQRLILQEELLDIYKKNKLTTLILNDLLSKGLDLNFTYHINANTDKDNIKHIRTPLMIILKQPQMIPTFLNNGAHINTTDENGNTALLLAILTGQDTAALNLINSHIVNQHNKDGDTALTAAVSWDITEGDFNTMLIKALLNAGADPEVIGSDGITPLKTMQNELEENIYAQENNEDFSMLYDTEEKRMKYVKIHINEIQEIINLMKNIIAKNHNKK